jgi:GlpG protein
MREIGVLPDAFQARTLADYLLTLRIDTRVEQRSDGCVLWVCDEDRVDQARKELADFLQNPREPRYAAASPRAEAIRQQEDAIEEDYGRRQTELRELMTDTKKPPAGEPFTIVLIVASVLVFAFSHFGEDTKRPLMQALFIAPFESDGDEISWRHLNSITRDRQVWRLVTPIFLHFNPLHLLFNVVMLYQLGGEVERRRGTWRFIVLVVTAATVSNLAQCYFGWIAQISKWRSGHGLNPEFGGLSGVNYALFGYVWAKSRLQPELGFVASPSLVAIMLAWFFLCFTGAVGSVANIAHAAGLGIGLLVGAAPTLWRYLMRQRPGL